jgi:TRAP-type C4-dicarboxylate transport system permease small subunit
MKKWKLYLSIISTALSFLFAFTWFVDGCVYLGKNINPPFEFWAFYFWWIKFALIIIWVCISLKYWVDHCDSFK